MINGSRFLLGNLESVPREVILLVLVNTVV